MSLQLVFRNTLEFVVLYVLWLGESRLIDQPCCGINSLIGGVLCAAWLKTAFFGVENLRQLRRAADENWKYYRFLLLMLVNMVQIVASFALDFHLLHRLDADSFSSIREGLSGSEQMFEFFYYSSLNFMFFGYGDITPQTIPAKLLTLTEIALAFITVIFLLSDFISLKDSLKRQGVE